MTQHLPALLFCIPLLTAISHADGWPEASGMVSPDGAGGRLGDERHGCSQSGGRAALRQKSAMRSAAGRHP